MGEDDGFVYITEETEEPEQVIQEHLPHFRLNYTKMNSLFRCFPMSQLLSQLMSNHHKRLT